MRPASKGCAGWVVPDGTELSVRQICSNLRIARL
jgi:hypothetical protein